MIKEMRKLQIIGPKAYLDECIKVLHAAAVVHIETIPADKGAEFLKRLPMEKEKLKEKESLESASDRLKNLLLLLKPPQYYRTERVGGEEIAKFLEHIRSVEENVLALHAEKDELTEELAAVNRYERLLRNFAPIVSRLGGLKNFDIVGLTIEKTREDIPKLIDHEVNKATGGSYQIFVKELDENTVGVVLTYPKKFEPKIRYLLTGKSINEIRLPDEYAGLPLIESLKIMRRKKEELPRRIQEIEGALTRLSEDWYATIAGLKRAVDDALDEIGAITYAAQTKYAFVIEGWVPADMLRPLGNEFGRLFGDTVIVRELEIKKEETDLIPVHIINPKALRPFEVFLAALPAPKYGSVDPTPFVALFFPIFFGLIVGDIGYGALIFALSFFLKTRLKNNPMLEDIATVISISSISAIIFGVLFGEFFGDLGTRLGIIQPVLFHRTESLKTLMLLTIGIGAGHVLLGILISIVNHLYRGKTREAGANIAFFVLITASLAVIGMMFEYLPKGFLTQGIIVLVLAFFALTALEGIMGPLEFVKALGNILSYVRIMAVGTASVVMALVANRLGSVSENIAIGVIAAGLFHILNLVLSILSPSIQSMRLHYVEFFSKFYEGGGRKYTPFKKR